MRPTRILTVVDAVSSLGGVRVPTGRIDVCLGASQKCFSAPPGLTTAAISDRAWAAMEERDPHSLYTNFLPWRDTAEGFPYTHLTTEGRGARRGARAARRGGTDAVRERHRAAATRGVERGAELGLEPYPAPERSSPTVTAFHVPGRAEELQRRSARSATCSSRPGSESWRTTSCGSVTWDTTHGSVGSTRRWTHWATYYNGKTPSSPSSVPFSVPSSVPFSVVLPSSVSFPPSVVLPPLVVPSEVSPPSSSVTAVV